MGPYIGNLGDYNSTFRDDNDNPVAPQWLKDRNTSDSAGTVSRWLTPKLTQPCPQPAITLTASLV